MNEGGFNGGEMRKMWNGGGGCDRWKKKTRDIVVSVCEDVTEMKFVVLCAMQSKRGDTTSLPPS